MLDIVSLLGSSVMSHSGSAKQSQIKKMSIIYIDKEQKLRVSAIKKIKTPISSLNFFFTTHIS